MTRHGNLTKVVISLCVFKCVCVCVWEGERETFDCDNWTWGHRRVEEVLQPGLSADTSKEIFTAGRTDEMRWQHNHTWKCTNTEGLQENDMWLSTPKSQFGQEPTVWRPSKTIVGRKKWHIKRVEASGEFRRAQAKKYFKRFPWNLQSKWKTSQMKQIKSPEVKTAV